VVPATPADAAPPPQVGPLATLAPKTPGAAPPAPTGNANLPQPGGPRASLRAAITLRVR
jgi:hypothetical protein